ncbi:MAG TPA: TadE family protein [Gemmatimonadaceae bacterium]|nr:TadE family protein [Gemmatimonadaceae bacterium]
MNGSIQDVTPGAKPRALKRRGAAALELAVAMPLLVLVCIGVMDFGRVYFTSVAVANAARAGAEWGTTPLPGYAFNSSGQQSFAQMDGGEVGAITFTPPPSTVCRCGENDVPCSTTPTCGTYGVPKVFVTVTATKSVALLLPYPGLPSSISIVRSATFRAQ